MLILDLAFPYFRGETSVHRNLKQIYTRFYGPGSLKFLRHNGPRRRFSGDQESSQPLPRGRYYAVCDMSSGKPEDHGLLQFELSAYSHHSVSGPVMIFDRASQNGQSMVEKMGLSPAVSNQALTIIIFRKAGAPGLIDILYKLKDIDPDINFDDYGGVHGIIKVEGNPFSFLDTGEAIAEFAYSFNLYYEFETIAFDQVLDLRYPEVQTAFANLFFPNIAMGSEVAPLQALAQMLPTIVSTDHGGNVTTDAIGNFLRAHGVDGLIYPSARFNAGVRFEGYSIADFGGWNFVDYRDTEMTDYQNPPYKLFEASCPLQVGIFGTNEDGFTSWKIRGLREHAMLEFKKNVRSYFHVQKQGENAEQGK